MKNSWSDITNRIILNVGWNIVGAVVTRACTMFLSFMLARTMGKEVFGEYGLVVTSITLASNIISFGTSSTITRFVSAYKSENKEKVAGALGVSYLTMCFLGLILITCSILFSSIISVDVFREPKLKPYLVISACSAFFVALVAGQQSLLIGLEAFKIGSLCSLLTNIIQSIIVLIAVRWCGLIGGIVALLVSSILSFAIVGFAANRELNIVGIKINLRFIVSNVSEVLNCSIPSFLATTVVALISWWSSIILVKTANGFGEVGVYNAAIQWELVIVFVPGLIAGSMFPLLTDLIQKNRIDYAFKMVYWMVFVTAVATFAGAGFISFNSVRIMNYYGKSFEGGEATLTVVVFGAACSATAANLGVLLNALGRMWLGFWLNLLWGTIFILGCMKYSQFGAFGIASARLCSYAVHFVICFLVLKKIVSTDYKK